MARLLLDRGASVRQVTRYGSTPLYFACTHGRTAVAELLLDRGAEVDWEGDAGMTPLYTACYQGRVGAALLLLKRGADINRLTSSGTSPVTAARNNGHDTMAAWLARIRTVGSWTRYHSEPRYELVVLRELVLRGRAWRQRTFQTKADVVEMLFPGPARYSFPDTPRLPDELFSIILSYYWGGVLSAEERTAAAAEAAAAAENMVEIYGQDSSDGEW